MSERSNHNPPSSGLIQAKDANISKASHPEQPHSKQQAKLEWQEAVALYIENHRTILPIDKAPHRTLNPMQVAVAQLIWDNRRETKQNPQRIVHISNDSGLVAAYSARQQLVQLKDLTTAPASRASPQNLQYRILPSSADLLDAQSAEGFINISTTHLMWLYGQSSAGAAHDMPDLRDCPLSVRRFPDVPPSLLDLRQLYLIHQLNQNSLTFTQLQRDITEANAAHLCADLASLFYTGVLRIAVA